MFYPYNKRNLKMTICFFMGGHVPHCFLARTVTRQPTKTPGSYCSRYKPGTNKQFEIHWVTCIHVKIHFYHEVTTKSGGIERTFFFSFCCKIFSLRKSPQKNSELQLGRHFLVYHACCLVAALIGSSALLSYTGYMLWMRHKFRSC